MSTGTGNLQSGNDAPLPPLSDMSHSLRSVRKRKRERVNVLMSHGTEAASRGAEKCCKLQHPEDALVTLSQGY